MVSYCKSGCDIPKQHFIAMVCNSKSISWHDMSRKLNIARKIAGLKIMTLNRERM